MDDTWRQVDAYLEDALVPDDPTLVAVLAANAAAGLPAHDVSPTQAKFLSVLAKVRDARRILEIGTLGGYSAIWLARALPSDGRLTTLEVDAARAQVARSNIARAGLEGQVDVRVGPALESLRALQAEGAGPFDLVFIDADKPNHPEYLEWAVALSRPGSVIVGDNVVRDGAVADAASPDPSVIGVRAFLERMGRHPRLSATALQTVGVKGYDGFAVAVVLPANTPWQGSLPKTGRCTCGAVVYRLTSEPLTVYACHCTDCQRLGSSAFRISMPVRRDAVELIQGEPERFEYRPIDATPKRGMRCGACSTWLWGEPERLPQVLVLRPSTLDDPSGIDPVAHIWVRSKQPWVRIPGDALAFDRQPPDERDLVRAWRAKHPR